MIKLMCQKSNRQAEIWQREDNQRALVSLVAFLDPVFPNYWNLDHLSILLAGPGKKEKRGEIVRKHTSTSVVSLSIQRVVIV